MGGPSMVELSGSVGYNFDWSVITQYLGLLLSGLKVTFEVSIVAEGVGLIIGLAIGLMKSNKSPFLWIPASAFVDVFRAIPLLVLLIWLYYGLAIILNIDMSPFQAGVLGLGLLYGAFLAEVFRAGLQAVPAGQREAAMTLGLSRYRTAVHIVIPQAVRIVAPALANSYIGMVKDATLVSVVGLTEIMRTAQTVVVITFRPFEIYTFVAAVYLVIVVIFSRLVGIMERRLK
jgi:His/Glu/Gln/Arg/opine family amino acid ABC transporter permease subunit